MDMEKEKYQLSKEIIKKYPHGQPTFKKRLESQINQCQRHGEQIRTNQLQHKKLYGYIHEQDALHLETVKHELFMDYATIKKQLKEQLIRCEKTTQER